MRGKAAALTALLVALAVPATAQAATTLTLSPDADARVDEAAPSTNFGTSYLRANGGSQPDVESFLRFQVPASGSIQSARLRLWVTNGTVDGPAVYSATPNTWTESGTGSITWANRPERQGPGVDDKGAIAASNWVEYNVTSLVGGGGTRTLALATTSTDGVDFSSREATATQRPQLVVEVQGTGPPVNTSLPGVTGTAREGRILTASTGTWTGADPISYAYQWRRCDAAGNGCSNIGGATAGTYALTAADVGSTLRIQVTASNTAGQATATSGPSGVVQGATVGDPVVAIAGDIASCAWSGDEATATLLDNIAPIQVLALGDNVYEDGTAAEFTNCYGPSWGRHKAITAPVPGNHEYQTSGASAYFNYFGALAGDPTKGYYAFDLGSWRLYALNSNCSFVSCSAGSAQEQWLRADLLANQSTSCKLAYWHHPRFSSASSSGLRTTSSVGPLYQAFYDASGDVLFQGHAHFYERMARLNPSGNVDSTNGVRNFVVGTGGAPPHGIGSARTGSEVRNGNTTGVIRLTLRDGSYSWQFTPIAGQTFGDSGTDTCAGTAQDVSAPTAPGNLTASAPSGTQVNLSWNASTDNVGVTGYNVYRNGTQVASVAGTSAADTTVSPGTSYSYTVRARDAAGNLSSPSNTATVTTPGGAGGTTLTIAPEADARVDEATPTTNFGTSFLRANGGSEPDVQSFLRFNVNGVTGQVRSARLRIWATSGTVDGPAAYSVTGNWTELAVTWANRPSLSGGGVDDKGAIAAASWVEWDVTSLVAASLAASNVTPTLGLVGTSTDGVDFSAKEATNAANRPQLVVTFGP
jgi:chitodextrinase